MLERKNKYTTIIWDWNGTLLNDAWLCVDVMNGMLMERGLPLRTIDEYREVFDFPVRDYYEKLGYDFEKEPFEIIGMEFMVLYNRRQHETKLHEGVFDILGWFRKHGFRQLILSAREQSELIEETKSLGVYAYFDRIYGLDDHYAHGKTDVAVRLLADIGVPADQIVFIGDTRHDAEVAKECGIECILIPNGHHSRQRLESLGVEMVDGYAGLQRRFQVL